MWLPRAVVLARLAVALPPDSVAVPRSSPTLSTKWTVPPGVPAPGPTAATVAVNITLCPNTDGLLDELIVVLVLAWLTVCGTLFVEALVMKLLSPW